MTRRLFSEDELLDAARHVVIARGSRSATIAAISAQAGAPTGSIYHRFASVDDLLARCWLRAVRRTQEMAEATPPVDDALAYATGLALSAYDHCVENPEDAVLLDKLRRPDVLALKLSPQIRSEIEASDAVTATTMSELARSVFGRADGVALDRLVLAVVDLPYGFAQRYLVDARRPPAERRALLLPAVRAVLTDPNLGLPATGNDN
jgi:AcrR family transcriptional regulator